MAQVHWKKIHLETSTPLPVASDSLLDLDDFPEFLDSPEFRKVFAVYYIVNLVYRKLSVINGPLWRKQTTRNSQRKHDKMIAYPIIQANSRQPSCPACSIARGSAADFATSTRIRRLILSNFAGLPTANIRYYLSYFPYPPHWETLE